MTASDLHRSHPAITAGLKRAEGHPKHVIAMLQEAGPDIATQLQAAQRAVSAAKRTLIHDHFDHCLTPSKTDRADVKALAKQC